METSTTTQNLVIPRVVSPAGWIASAQTYRLIFNEEGLHLIHLGRAMGNRVKSGDMIADALANKLVNRMEANLEAKLAIAESEIKDLPLPSLLQRKRSIQVPLFETGAVTCKVHPGLAPKLIIKAAGIKLKLIGPDNAQDSFQKIANAFAGELR